MMNDEFKRERVYGRNILTEAINLKHCLLVTLGDV